MTGPSGTSQYTARSDHLDDPPAASGPGSALDGLATGTYPAVASGFAPGQLDVFTTGADGTLYHRVFQDSTHTWSPWMPLDTSVSAGATLASAALPGDLFP